MTDEDDGGWPSNEDSPPGDHAGGLGATTPGAEPTGVPRHLPPDTGQVPPPYDDGDSRVFLEGDG